jgi:hypothetical protein
VIDALVWQVKGLTVEAKHPATVDRRLVGSRCSQTNRRRYAVTVVPLFYTNSADYPAAVRDPYHENDECRYGQQIKPEDRLPGHGNRFRCDECKSTDRRS